MNKRNSDCRSLQVKKKSVYQKKLPWNIEPKNISVLVWPRYVKKEMYKRDSQFLGHCEPVRILNRLFRKTVIEKTHLILKESWNRWRCRTYAQTYLGVQSGCPQKKLTRRRWEQIWGQKAMCWKNTREEEEVKSCVYTRKTKLTACTPFVYDTNNRVWTLSIPTRQAPRVVDDQKTEKIVGISFQASP